MMKLLLSVPQFVSAFVLALATIAAPANSQSCGKDYAVESGDTLQKLAKSVYGDAGKWTYIFYANQDRLASHLKAGQVLRIPCIGTALGSNTQNASADAPEQSQSRPSAIALSSSVKSISFLTADDYRPFTDRSMLNGGMLTDVVSSAMDVLKTESKGKLKYKLNWVNDWAAHLDPLLSSRAFDMGFPWHKPACDDPATLSKAARLKCEKFFFSEPLFEGLVLFFASNKSDFKFETDRSVKGRNICWPVGWATYFLDHEGRNWTKDRGIVLLRPQTLQECFRLVGEGVVDAVIADEFSGRTIMLDQKLADKMRIIDRPVAIETLHIVVNRFHPKARILIHYVNSGIKRIRANGNYEDIVERHLSEFWETERSKRLETTASVKPAPKPKDATSQSPTATEPRPKAKDIAPNTR